MQIIRNKLGQFTSEGLRGNKINFGRKCSEETKINQN
jgi:hypothetical protein